MARKTSPTSAGVFISYRRTDSAYALLIYKALLQQFDSDHVYRDIEGIEPGADFIDALKGELERCKVMLALIGSGWLRARKRLLDGKDVVRLEVFLALQRDVIVVPVLVGGAKMPTSRDLPKVLAPLSGRNAIVVSDVRFDRDVETVVEALGKHIPRKASAATAAGPVTYNDIRVAELLRRQVHRLQIRAVELVQAGEVDRALEELAEGYELIMELLRRTPSDARLDAQLGYLYKTIAQALDAAGDPHANEYLDLAANVFTGLQTRADAHSLPADRVAEAINGLGNIFHQRKDFEKAIRNYEAAVRIAPDYAYAWHDLFAALLDRANSGGKIDVPKMQHALERVKQIGAGQPGLGAAQIALLERALVQTQVREAARRKLRQ